MAILNIPNTFVDATTAEASEVNANFTAVKQFAEGLSDGTNIDSSAIIAAKIATGAVVEAKIASGAVTTAKIADDAVTAAKIAADVPTLDQIILAGQVFG